MLAEVWSMALYAHISGDGTQGRGPCHPFFQ